MTMNNALASAGILVFALGVGCGPEGPTTTGKSVISAGSGATPGLGGAGGATLQPVAGTAAAPTAGTRAIGAAGSPPVAGQGPTAGSGPTATAGGPAATAGGPAATAGGPAAAGSGPAAGGSGTGGAAAPTGGTGMSDGGKKGACCKDGDCLCHGDPPTAPTNSPGPFKTATYDIASAGCVYYPMDAEPPFAAVAISDGFLGTGGCGLAQTSQWGPLYASWGIVAMIVHTAGGDQPNQRGAKLSKGVEAFKMENQKSGSPLMGKLSGRYGTSGFSMGGGGSTFAAMDDPMLKTSVAIMAYGPAWSGIMVPSLYIFGSSDGLANTMGMSAYRSMSGTVPKMAVTINSGHEGQPSSGSGASGKAGLAFQKVFLENDERWRPVLLMIDADDKANIE